MFQFNLDKAVHWNPYYARKTGWRKRYGQVMNALGFNNMCPGEENVAPVGAGNAIQR